MPIGFGLGDSPFSSGGGYSSFDDLSRSVSASTASVPAAGASGGGSSSGGSWWDGFTGVLGNAVSRIADFGTDLFIWDELSERGQTSTTSNQTTHQTGITPGGANTGTGTATASGSLINGVSNQTLFIGLAVVFALILLFRMGK